MHGGSTPILRCLEFAMRTALTLLIWVVLAIPSFSLDATAVTCVRLRPRPGRRPKAVSHSAALSPASLRTRPCLATPDHAVVGYVQELAAAAERGVELPFGLEASFFLLVLALAQCELGIEGAVGELGAVFSGGILSFSALLLLRRDNDTLFLSGPFGGSSEDGFDLPLGSSFDVASIVFRGPSARADDAGPHRLPRLRRLATAPTWLTEAELLRYSGGAGFRVLRVDRTRSANETLRLLRAAACALVSGGLLVFEGVQGMNDRPSLQEGFHRFMLETEAMEQRIVPFFWAGKHGGLFLTDEGHAELYRRRLQGAVPQAAILNHVYDTKFMYGSRVMFAHWEAQAESFEGLLRHGRRAG